MKYIYALKVSDEEESFFAFYSNLNNSEIGRERVAEKNQ